MMELLFAYGTLQDAHLLQRLLGRTVHSRIAHARGWRTTQIEIDGERYPCAVRGEGVLSGRLLVVTREELTILDDFETVAYDREEVVLEDATTAWIYVKRNR